ncbi:MAG: PD-(D/E)XK nuclease family protein [Planctomycetaceae bacterium]|nr:PD-(D/E)XK nuclease family protein [Planctomycetaceae bacterium]
MPVTRHFIDWKQPVLPAAADYLIERYGTSQQLDLSNVVIVFTGRRASRRMLEVLFEKASDRWPAFVPPQLTTFQQFPEMLYRQQHRWADDLTQLLIWKKALSSIPAADLKAALPSIPDDDAVPSWLSLCESLRRQHNELAEDGIEFDAVQQALERAGNHKEALRWRALRRIQSEYLMQLDRLQLWDRQASRLIAVEQNECVADFDIVLLGTVDMNQVVRSMLLQVQDRVTAIVHAPSNQAHRFDDLGCLLAEEWVETRLNIPVADSRVVDGPEGQAEQLVREVAALDGTRRADDIAVGVADESLVPIITQKLAAAGLKGRWPVEMELSETRPFRLIQALTEHLSSGSDAQPPDFETFSRLVRHPDLDAMVEESVRRSVSTRRAGNIDWLTELDKYTARHLQSSPGVLLGPKRPRQIVGGIIDAVEGMLRHLSLQDAQAQTRVLGKQVPQQKQLLFDDQAEVVPQDIHQQLQSRRPLAEWGRGLLRMLAAVYQNRELDPQTRRDRGISECCQAITSAVEQLQQVPESVMPVCTAAQGLQMILRHISETSIPPEADDAAIDLLGWLELAMDDAPVLLLTGFNEGFVPESLTSDVFLPNTFRTELGLRDNRRRYARDAYALTTMMGSREQIVFIAGRRDAKGNPQMPSRLWFAADRQSLPDRVQRFYDEESVDQAGSPGGDQAAGDAAATASELSGRRSGFTIPGPAPLPERPAEITVTSFRDYLYCPYRYFLKRELRLKSIDDETLELEAAAFGSLMHDVLKQFGQSAVVHALRPEPIEEFLLKSLHGFANRRFGRNHSATVAVQLQMMQNRLSAFAHWQASTAKEGWRIRYTEEDLKYPEFTDALGRSVTLAGRVDRIDQHERTGHWRVLDYKTSERADKPESTHRTRGEWVDLQLPLYRLLVRSLGLTENVQLGYVHLPGDLAAIGSSIADWSQEDLKSAEETARQVAADICDLKIDRIAAARERRYTEFARVCQDTVIESGSPWLGEFSGRAS